MENFLEVAKRRYATKMYDANYVLDEKTLNQIAEILRLSPSAANLQPWKFTIITNKKLKEELSKEAFGLNKERIEKASALIVLSYSIDADLTRNKFLGEMYKGYFDKFDDEKLSNYASKQVYLAAGFLTAALATMKLDSTVMEGFNQEEYYRILKQDKFFPALCILVGKRDKDDFNQPDRKPKSRRPLEEVVEFRL